MFITGTRKGIGKYLVEYYTSKGFQVIGCSRDPIDFEITNYQHFCLDIVDETNVKKMFSHIRKSFGRLDFLINNAAINPAIAPAILIPINTVLQILEVNFLGTFLMSREAAKLMSKNAFGRIINFGSMAVKHEVSGESVYTASKAAINSFSKVFAKEIHPMGITCNVVSPSAIKTDLSANVDADALSDVLKRNAVHCFGEMEDISNTIDWILKPESHTITGQIIYLGGA